MEIELCRDIFAERCTIGRLMIDGQLACHTLEPHAIDWENEKKIWGKTAIPEGTYKVVLSPSQKFKRLMPYLLNVPHFNGIMIHPGNFANDTQGCILVGWQYYRDVFGVYDSKATHQILYHLIQEAEMRGEDVTIKVSPFVPNWEGMTAHPRFDRLYRNYCAIAHGYRKRVNAE